MHIDRIPVYRVYQRAIDLELYHAFAELVVQTSQDDTARRTYRQTRAMQIWQVETDVSGYFEPYHLRYPGEVLERFEEKLGNDVRVLRALALALGNTCAIQSDNMFVGNQRGAFLQKLRRSAGEDVYLQGALYLLETDAARRHDLLDELAAKVYVRTEEALKSRAPSCRSSFPSFWSWIQRRPCRRGFARSTASWIFGWSNHMEYCTATWRWGCS